MEQRVAIFIDGSNLYHALRENLGRTDLNFSDFAKKLAGDRPLVRIYYYNALQDPQRYPEASKEQAEFLTVLRNVPYLEVRLGGMKLSQGQTVEKGVDVMLATDVLNFSWVNVYDTAVLVSGDGDFCYVLQTIKNMGKHLEVAYFEGNAAKDLLELADVRYALDKAFFEGLWSGRSRVTRARPRRRRGGTGRSGETKPETSEAPV